VSDPTSRAVTCSFSSPTKAEPQRSSKGLYDTHVFPYFTCP
jgi:hypothetical protein